MHNGQRSYVRNERIIIPLVHSSGTVFMHLPVNSSLPSATAFDVPTRRRTNRTESTRYRCIAMLFVQIRSESSRLRADAQYLSKLMLP